MPIRILLAALAATASLAACGGDGQPASSSGREAAARRAMLQFASCMRAHGVPMKDPQFNGDGGVTLSSGGPGERKVPPATERAAEQACNHFMRQVKPPAASPADQAEFRKKALANARCMRSHGVPKFPDPQFGTDGQASIRFGKGTGIDPQSPAFQRAMRACAKYLPNLRVGG
jgi:hypothetical protein